MDREDAVEPCDLEDLADVLVGADDRERAAGRAQALDASDEDAQGRRVDERGLRQVDYDLLLALLDDLDHALLELWRGVEVDLATELDDVRLGVDLLVLDVKVQGRSFVVASGGKVADGVAFRAIRTALGCWRRTGFPAVAA